MGVVSSLYKGHRYPVKIISHGVWLYHRFTLSFREVEERRRRVGSLSMKALVTDAPRVLHRTGHQRMPKNSMQRPDPRSSHVGRSWMLRRQMSPVPYTPADRAWLSADRRLLTLVSAGVCAGCGLGARGRVR